MLEAKRATEISVQPFGAGHANECASTLQTWIRRLIRHEGAQRRPGYCHMTDSTFDTSLLSDWTDNHP